MSYDNLQHHMTDSSELDSYMNHMCELVLSFKK